MLNAIPRFFGCEHWLDLAACVLFLAALFSLLWL